MAGEADALLDELRGLADDDLAAARTRLGELPAATVREVAGLLLADDASRRAAAEVTTTGPPPPADLLLLAEALDDAAAVSAALESIDDFEGLIRGVFDAITDAEARLLVFERAFRAMIDRRGDGRS